MSYTPAPADWYRNSLIVDDVPALSDDDLEGIEKHVSGGGALLLTGRSVAADERLLPRLAGLRPGPVWHLATPVHRAPFAMHQLLVIDLE
jgi:hypothetical protein